MLLTAIILLAINLLLLCWLAVRQFHAQRALRTLRMDTQELAPLHAELGPQLRKELAEARSRVLSVEILNPLEVAAKESWVAGQFGALAPALIQREVYRQARDILEAQLREYGIEPRVRLLGGR